MRAISNQKKLATGKKKVCDDAPDSLSHICFLTSTIPLDFDTDGHTFHYSPIDPNKPDLEKILVLTDIHIERFQLQKYPEISLYSNISLPSGQSLPVPIDNAGILEGKKILIYLFSGWGDLILMQPAFEALYSKYAANGSPPQVTIACNWVDNFPYPDAPFIDNIRTNIMTLKDFCTYDAIINLMPLNHQKSMDRSMLERSLEIMSLSPAELQSCSPHLYPRPEKVSKIRPVTDNIRRESGKGILYLNWKSRLPHKDAAPALFFDIARMLKDRYTSVLFKDQAFSRIMQSEISVARAPIMNLSHLINDFHDTIAALSLCDAFVSVDTGIVHAAGALGIPGVALFGPFPPETHISNYKTVFGIRSDFSGKACQEGPCLETHCGCAETQYAKDAVSPCFASFKPEEIINAFDFITRQSRHLVYEDRQALAAEGAA